MDKKDEAFLKKLLATFRMEAEEHIAKIATGLIDLEKVAGTTRQGELIEAIFREAHSLKGAARAVNLGEIEAVCQAVESVFAALKRGEIEPAPSLFDNLHRSVDTLTRLLASASSGTTAAQKTAAKELSRELERAGRGGPARTGEKINLKKEETATAEPDPLPPAATVRIAAARMDDIMLEAEELLAAKLFLRQRVAELREIGALLNAWEKGWTTVIPEVQIIRRALEKDSGPGEALRKVLEFFAGNGDIVRAARAKLAAGEKSLEQDRRSLGMMTDNLLGKLKTALLLPFASLLEIFPKLVRDLSHGQGKDVELMVRGEAIEIDRRILEEIKDPLIHLVRNCLDHGLEKPEERVQAKKRARGLITIEVQQKEGGKVEIIVSDDGRGIDREGVKAAAVKAGLLSPEAAAAMAASDALRLVFLSGVSTSPIITDLSGRGLGLAIVREKFEKLGGTLSLETERAKGTSFKALLPVTLATFRGIIVRGGEDLFVLPLVNVERVLRLKREEIKTVENRETVEIEGKALSLVRLSAVLGISPGKGNAAVEKLPIVVIKAAEQRIALLVDEILSEQEVLVKGLGRQLKRVRNIAGATVLGTGRLASVLDVADLLKSAVQAPAGTLKALREAEGEEARKSVLVVEDSITARTLLKNILEAAGYDVKTAVDGLEAFTLLKTEPCELIVSDVDMPRMNGFELTARIRADKKLADLPVILVTALDTREDRERGIDVGANAYIVKSSFDQSNLLEAIGRLI